MFIEIEVPVLSESQKESELTTPDSTETKSAKNLPIGERNPGSRTNGDTARSTDVSGTRSKFATAEKTEKLPNIRIVTGRENSVADILIFASDPKYSKDPIKTPRIYAVAVFLVGFELSASHNNVTFSFNSEPKVSIPKVVTNERIRPISADDHGFITIKTATAVKSEVTESPSLPNVKAAFEIISIKADEESTEKPVRAAKRTEESTMKKRRVRTDKASLT